MHQEHTNLVSETIEIYEKPSIEIIEMEMEGNVLLQCSSGKNSNPGNGFDGWN